MWQGRTKPTVRPGTDERGHKDNNVGRVAAADQRVGGARASAGEPQPSPKAVPPSQCRVEGDSATRESPSSRRPIAATEIAEAITPYMWKLWKRNIS